MVQRSWCGRGRGGPEGGPRPGLLWCTRLPRGPSQTCASFPAGSSPRLEPESQGALTPPEVPDTPSSWGLPNPRVASLAHLGAVTSEDAWLGSRSAAFRVLSAPVFTHSYKLRLGLSPSLSRCGMVGGVTWFIKRTSNSSLSVSLGSLGVYAWVHLEFIYRYGNKQTNRQRPAHFCSESRETGFIIITLC